MLTFWELLTLLLIGVPMIGIFSIVPLLIWTHHRRKIEEIRLKGGRAIAEDIRTEFATIRAELHDLRDTCMQYDLSFDTALQQMERRVSKIERSAFLASESPTQHNVSVGR
ncbi:MAG TPA: hypothetical protein VKT77_17725 [Chthonomonadaceae bacterium]|nr:hypothetical protein [Chthonomonadaceae bacterium]